MNDKSPAKNDLEKILLTEKELAIRVKELGAQISADYAASAEPILLIGILRGAVVFLADLIRAIDIPVVFDFMAVASYGDAAQSSGAVRILKDLDENIAGKQVLIVEDIIDTGLTLSYLVENLKARNPAGIKICTLLNKPERRKAEIVPDYNGFDIEDFFVVGYGLDFAGKYRNLPFVGVLKSFVYAK
jgi:hypoxanthine phosphoribosyltransferase